MAQTPEGRRLTDAHRIAQVRIGQEAAAVSKVLWADLDPADLGRTREKWLRNSVVVASAYDAKSARLAAGYMERYRQIESNGTGPIVGMSGFDADGSARRLDYAGPQTIIKHLAAGRTPQEAKRLAEQVAAGSMQRQALQGGRRIIDLSSISNPRSIGWRRVADGNPCTFCALLVSRGPAFRSERSAGAGRAFHWKCGCTVEEVFDRWEPTDEEDQYIDSYLAAREATQRDNVDPTASNILSRMRADGQFGDSAGVRPPKASPPAATVEKTQLGGSFTPKPPNQPIVKTQLSGSFEPKPPAAQAPIVKTQLTGSFAPKVTNIVSEPLPGPAVTAKVEGKNSWGALLKPKVKPLAKVAQDSGSLPIPPVPPLASAPAAAAAIERRAFTGNADGRNWAARIWPGAQGYTGTQLQALRAYTGNEYQRINTALRRSRGRRGTPEVRHLDAAMTRAPRIPENILVTRNSTAAQFDLPDGADLNTILGQSFTEHGFLSTSVNARGAVSGSVQLKLSVPKGYKAIFVSGKSGAKRSEIISSVGGSEAELLINRGAQFRVTSVQKVGRRWIVEADIVNP